MTGLNGLKTMERTEITKRRMGHNPGLVTLAPCPPTNLHLLPEQQNNPFAAFMGQRKLLSTLPSRAYLEHIELTPVIPLSLERHHNCEPQK